MAENRLARKLELVLPCYNESKSIEKLINRAVNCAQNAGFSSENFNLIIVNNGSVDPSSHILDQLKQNNQNLSPWFRVVNIIKNEGYGNGIYQGLNACEAEYVAWSHADEQCDPLDVFRAYQELQSKGSHSSKVFIKGRRLGRDWKEKVVSKLFEMIASIVLRQNLSEINAQPKVFKRDLLPILKSPPKDFAFDLYVLSMAIKKGYEIKEIQVKFPPRFHGVSNWAFSLKNRFKTFYKMFHYILTLRREEKNL